MSPKDIRVDIPAEIQAGIPADIRERILARALWPGR
jgi:hypothetical protein